MTHLRLALALALLATDARAVDAAGAARAEAGEPSPIPALVRAAREALPAGWRPERGAVVVVQLPPGRLAGAAFSSRPGHSPLAKVEVDWLGAATLEVRGAPREEGGAGGTTIRPMHDEDGWGSSLAIHPHPGWEGRIHFVDLVVEASGGSAVEIGAFGTQEVAPLEDVRFTRCTFLDHPLDEVTCKQPISANQAALHFEGCVWDLPRSEEHAVYSRNPYGDSSMVACEVRAVGGQVWQEVGRPSEGPQAPPGTTRFERCVFRGYHRDPGRAGSALTCAGPARHWVIRDTAVLDLEPSAKAFPPGTTCGGLAVWDGGWYWDVEGRAHQAEDGPEVEPGFANRTLLVERCLFVQRDANRPPIQITSLQAGLVRKTGVYATRPVDLAPFGSDPRRKRDAGLLFLAWIDNEGPETRAAARALGVPDELLVVPEVHLGGKPIGRADEDFTIVASELVE